MQRRCEMVVVCNLRLVGYSVGRSVPEMQNTDEVGWIVAVHKMVVHDWAGLKLKQMLEPEVRYLPW